MTYNVFSGTLNPTHFTSPRKGQKMPFFVPGDLDLQTRPTEGPNVFRVNLAHIRSAVPEIFIQKQKIPQTDGVKNRTFRSSLGVVKHFCGNKQPGEKWSDKYMQFFCFFFSIYLFHCLEM